VTRGRVAVFGGLACAAVLGIAISGAVADAGSPQEGGVSGAVANKVGLASGEVNGWTTNRKFGTNALVGTTLEPIWAASIGTLPFLESAGTLSISSADDDDRSGGTGARTLTIFGLDDSFASLSEVVTLDGGTVVVSANSYCRVFRAFVSEIGTYGGANEGLITVVASTDGRLMATVSAGEAQTQQAIFTTSATQTAYVSRVFAGVESGKTVNIDLLTRESADVTSGPGMQAVRHRMPVTGLVAGLHEITFDAPLVIPPKTDVWLVGAVDVTAAAVSADFDMTIEDTTAP
jgi:hypothetical protein